MLLSDGTYEFEYQPFPTSDKLICILEYTPAESNYPDAPNVSEDMDVYEVWIGPFNIIDWMDEDILREIEMLALKEYQGEVDEHNAELQISRWESRMIDES
jgi:hypothetical protein